MAESIRLCSESDCGLPLTDKGARGLCPKHYSRLRRLGSTSLPQKMQDRACSVAACTGQARKLEMCATHYTRARKYGRTEAIRREWRPDEGGPCDWCASPVAGRRRYCRDACSVSASQHRRAGSGAPRTEVVACVRCGDVVPRDIEGTAARRKRSDVLMCDHCRRAKYTRHKASVSVLANRDGTDCGICGEPVDMTIRMPDLMSASVDHIYPYARGGSHDPSNLQLAHNICNRRKSARLLTPEAIASI